MSPTIAAAPLRRRTTVSGEVVSVVHLEHPHPCVDVVITDGTAQLLLHFMGRDHLPGMVAGRRITVEGTPADEHGTVIMRNPLYAFADEE
jgi:hypothetical protein